MKRPPDSMSPPRGLALTPTDLKLFRWLWMLRVLTLGQLRRLGYFQPEHNRLSSIHNVRKRMRRLWNAGYLSGDTLLKTRERIYFLAEPALPALRAHYGIEQRRLYRLSGLQSLRQIHHALMVSECAVRITESIRQSPISSINLPPLGVPFYHTHAVGDVRKKKHVERFVTQEDLRVTGHSSLHRIRPDLVFALAQQDIARLYFLEADQASESPQQIVTKQLAYHHYFEALDPKDLSQHRWQRYGAMPDFRVLLVTTDQRRVGTLTRALSGKPGFELMAISSIDAVKEKSMIFDPIWTNQYGDGRALARRLS